jgi:hypothetical protein
LAFPPRFSRPIQLNEEVARFTDRVYYKMVYTIKFITIRH